MRKRLSAAAERAGLMVANNVGQRGVKTLYFFDRSSTWLYPQANAD